MKCNYEVVTYLPQSKGTLKKSQSPPKSWGHTLNMYRGYLILFGGNNKSTRKRDSDLYSIDATNLMFNEWINFVPTEVDKEKNLIMPDSRDTHTANIIDHELYVVCGNNNGKCSEIWIFDFRKNNCKYPGWTCDPLGREMAIEGQSVEARESHVTMTYLNRFLVIYGGVTVT